MRTIVMLNKGAAVEMGAVFATDANVYSAKTGKAHVIFEGSGATGGTVSIWGRIGTGPWVRAHAAPIQVANGNQEVTVLMYPEMAAGVDSTIGGSTTATVRLTY